MPFGMLAMFVALVAIAVLYAMALFRTAQASPKAPVSALSSVSLPIGSFVVHNYVNLNIGLKLTVQQSIAYFVQWVHRRYCHRARL